MPPLTNEQLDQYQALTQRVGFVPLTGRTLIEVTGPDRGQILQSFTTNDVKRLTPGQGCEAFVTSPQGKTLGHLFIFCETDKHWIDATPDQAQPLIEHFNRYIITEDAFFTDKTAEFTDVLVAGPAAESLLLALTGQAAPATRPGQHAVTIAGQPAILRRVEIAGPQSYFLQVATPHTAAVIAALHKAGAVPCDHAAFESVRVEAGFPLFGLDIGPENLPQEVGRDARAISFTKGCYLGQETVARIDAIGHVNRLLAGIQLPVDVPQPLHELKLLATPSGGSTSQTDQSVGQITSVAWSPRLQAPLALAYLRRSFIKPGTMLSTSHGPAHVVGLPLAASA